MTEPINTYISINLRPEFNPTSECYPPGAEYHKPLARVGLSDDANIVAADVDRLLALADAAQEAARQLRLAQLDQQRGAGVEAVSA